MAQQHGSLFIPTTSHTRRFKLDWTPIPSSCKVLPADLQCGKDAELLHEKTCAQTNHVHRHNGIRDHTAAALGKCVPTEVIVEPQSDEGARRKDIGLRGPGRSGRRALDYDLKGFLDESRP